MATDGETELTRLRRELARQRERADALEAMLVAEYQRRKAEARAATT